MAPVFEFNQCIGEGGGNSNACCNGLSTNCDLRMNEIMYAGVHNAMAAVQNGFNLGPNHDFELESALKRGYRALNLDICNCGGQYQFCHGFCGIGSRDPSEVLGNINAFLDDNPNEVVIIVFEVNDAADRVVDLDVFYELGIASVDGLEAKIYQHPVPSEPWPTLSDAIAGNSVSNGLLFFS
jgi:hypothetical protein